MIVNDLNASKKEERTTVVYRKMIWFGGGGGGGEGDTSVHSDQYKNGHCMPVTSYIATVA